MSPKKRRFFAGFVALIVLVGFLGIYGCAFFLTLNLPANASKPPELSPALIYVGTALAGLIGAVVAMFFNEKLPDDPETPAVSRQGSSLSTSPSASGPDAGVEAIRNLAKPDTDNYLDIISTIYTFGYLFYGIIAIFVWVKVDSSKPDLVLVPDIIKNLALISIGLFIAIARSFFTVPSK